MKIVHVTSQLVRAGAGVREVVLELARAQMRLGADVEVVGLSDPSWVSQSADWVGVSTVPLAIAGPRGFGYAPAMTATLLDRKPDIVHLHGVWTHAGRSVLKWARRSGRPYVVSPHGMLSPVALSYSRWKKNVVSLWFQNEVFASAAAIHVTSEREKLDVRAYGVRSPLCLFPNGVNILAAPPVIRHPHNEGTILALGRLHSIKGLDQLIRAWAELEGHFPGWRVRIVGPDEGGEQLRLQQLAAGLKLKRVEFCGPAYGEDKIRALASADIFALPSRSENFGITVAESLMLKVPVVATRGTPWARLEAEGCGLWVDFGAESLERALRELIEAGPTQRGRMGDLGREWMLREFTWPTVAQQSLECYAPLVGEQHPARHNTPSAV